MFRKEWRPQERLITHSNPHPAKLSRKTIWLISEEHRCQNAVPRRDTSNGRIRSSSGQHLDGAARKKLTQLESVSVPDRSVDVCSGLLRRTRAPAAITAAPAPIAAMTEAPPVRGSVAAVAAPDTCAAGGAMAWAASVTPTRPPLLFHTWTTDGRGGMLPPSGQRVLGLARVLSSAGC